MKPYMWAIGLGLVFALMGLGLWLGEVSLSLGELGMAMTRPQSLPAQIVWGLRLPRNLCALSVGAMLGLAGALMQGLLRNPLAEPGILGVSAGAGLGAALAIVLGLGLVPFAVEGAAMVMAALTALILLLFISRFSQGPSIILLGVGLTSLMGALMALVFNLSPSPVALSEVMGWMMGSVENRNLSDVIACASGLLLASVFIPKISSGLSALTLGEATAKSMGFNLKSIYLISIVIASLLSGLSVAVAGIIGFVGLCAPHLVRALGLRDPAALLWPSALAGAIIVLSADILVRLIPLEATLHLGVLISLIGAPTFVVITRRASGAWQGE
jgi:iron complex transport system permease protein